MAEAQATRTALDATQQQQTASAFELLRQGRAAEAGAVAEALRAAHPGNAQVLHLCSETQLALGNDAVALQLIDAAIAAAAEPRALLLRKAHLLLGMRRRNDARNAAAAALALAGDDADTLWAVGRIHGKCDDPIAAGELYQRAIDAGGNHPSLKFDLAGTQFFTGHFLAAERTLDALLADAPRHGHALHLRSILRRQTAGSNHVADLESRLRAGFDEPAARAACLYALSKELEDLGESGKSFAVLAEAAATKRRTLRHDAAAERESIAAIRERWTAEAMQAASMGHDEEGPIFIVGMPRTGTTLVERMLGRHSEVRSAGELLDFGQALSAAARRAQAAHPGKSLVEASLLLDFAALGRDYLGSAREAAADSHWFVDKMPVNYIYCGLIRKALPRARIIHVVRDPMDSCFAIYKTLFNQSYLFSYDLDELADYYVTYHRQMQHWHAVMPGDILDVRYEALVSDTETQARRLLDWCGLTWQDAVLAPSANAAPSTTASAAQVREPVHARSVGRWREHEAALAPLRFRLLEAGVIGN
jgi:tetratricopeptide (TPR) repeat protein